MISPLTPRLPPADFLHTGHLSSRSVQRRFLSAEACASDLSVRVAAPLTRYWLNASALRDCVIPPVADRLFKIFQNNNRALKH